MEVNINKYFSCFNMSIFILERGKVKYNKKGKESRKLSKIGWSYKKQRKKKTV